MSVRMDLPLTRPLYLVVAVLVVAVEIARAARAARVRGCVRVWSGGTLGV